VTAPLETQPIAPSDSGVDLALASTALVTLPGAAAPSTDGALASTGSLPAVRPEPTPSEALERIALLDRPPPPASVRRRRRGRAWRVAFALAAAGTLAAAAVAALSTSARGTMLSALPPAVAAPITRALTKTDAWLRRPSEPRVEATAPRPRDRRTPHARHDAPARALAGGAATPTATAPTPAAEGVVEVRVTTRPPGAEVRSAGGTTLGRTPLTLRSPAGTAHELTFAKNGFANVKRRLVVDADKPNVVVDLARAKPGRRRR
jgi:hypothetical protein